MAITRQIGPSKKNSVSVYGLWENNQELKLQHSRIENEIVNLGWAEAQNLG